VEVNGKPFVVHQLRLLRESGITRVVLCVGHLGEMIEQAIGDGKALGVEVEYSFDGPVLLGTAGALKKALPKLGDSFFVMYGDSYLACDYRAVERAFFARRRLALMTVFRNEGRWDKSNVEFAEGEILRYDKKQKTSRMHFIDYGLGVFHAKAFEQLPPGRPFDLAELYQELLRAGQLAGWEVPERFYEIGSAAGLQDTSDYLAGRKDSPE
jgi:N-acetyl-alpha-D-muramate 1-phosphate uridylyltransferase